jgi:hypothetical protein
MDRQNEEDLCLYNEVSTRVLLHLAIADPPGAYR